LTENSPWQPPAGPPPPPPGGPGSRPTPAPGANQPLYGERLPAGHASAGQTPGWQPPPKPGLIPLRPLGFGTLLGASFQVLRRNPRPTFGIALLLNGIVTLLLVGVIGGVAAFAFGRVGSATQESADEVTAGAVGAVVLASLIPLALSVLVGAVLQGIISLEVSRATIGEKLTTRGLWRLARGRIGALIGWSAIVTGAVIVAIVVLALLITLIVSFGGTAGVVIGVILGVLAALGAVVLWFWLATRLSLIPSVLMLERLTLRAAIARSWSLTTGYFWKTLGTQLLVNVIVQTAAQVVSFPVSMVLGIGTALLSPNGELGEDVWLLVVSYLITTIIALVFGAIATVTVSAVTALIYIDIRMRKEGLDLELMRFVEARQTGEAGAGNPYLPAGAAVASAPRTPSGDQPAGAPNDSPWA
jgi:hypothetical protein